MKLKHGLIGCGIGCGALALIAISSCVGFAIWINRGGELIDSGRLLGPGTTGYVEWTLRMEDPGTEGFVESVLESLERLGEQGGEELPRWLRAFQTRQSRRRADRFRELFPLLVAWTLQPGEQPGEDLHQFSASLTGLGNRMVFADWTLGLVLGRDQNGRIREHGDEKIYQVQIRGDRWITFFVRGNDLFFCSDLAAARLAVDRLREPELTGAGGELADLFAKVATDHALRGALVNHDGTFNRLLGPLPDDGWSGALGLTVAGGLEAGGSFRARVEFVGREREWAEARADAVTELVNGWIAGRFGAEVSERVSGGRVTIDVVVPGVIEAMEQLR